MWIEENKIMCEKHHFLGCDVVLSGKIWSNHLVGYLFGLIIDSENGGNTFLRNVGKLMPDYTESPTGQSQTRKPQVQKCYFIVSVLFHLFEKPLNHIL
jgi:hypothetical protein